MVFVTIIYAVAHFISSFYVLSFLTGSRLIICAFVNSSSTNTVILQVNKRRMKYPGACKRLRDGFIMKAMMKQFILILKNSKI
jgi:hypothetical protein